MVTYGASFGTALLPAPADGQLISRMSPFEGMTLTDH